MARVRTSLEGERVGLFTLDPGRTSGITASTPLLEGSVQEIFDRDPIFVDEVDCDDIDVEPYAAEFDGAQVIVDTYLQFEFNCHVEKGIPKTRIFFVYEDFILYGGKGHSSDRSGLAAVRVASLVQGRLMDKKILWVPQSASDAKSTVTNERLKRWDLWTRGMEHGRDATRHAGLWVRRALA